MVRWMLAALLVAPASLPARAQDGSIQLDFTAKIQADGVPIDIVPDASLSPPLQAMVRKRVATWRYKPGTWQGAAVPGSVSQRILAAPVPVTSGGYALRVREVTQPMRTIAADDPLLRDRAPSMYPPIYPKEMQRRGVSAIVVFAMRADPQGRPIELELVYPERPDRVQAAFVAAARAAVENWTLTGMKVGDELIDCRRVIPITFQVDGAKALEADTNAYRAAHPDVCPRAPTLVTKVEGTLL